MTSILPGCGWPASGITAALLMTLASMSPAAPLTWGPTGGGGSGTWDANQTANWFNASNAVTWPAPGGSDDDAVFGGSPGIVSLAAGGISANDLTFSVSGYSLMGAPLTLNGSTPSITTSPSVEARIDSAIAGTSGFRKLGTGTLILSKPNPFSGNVTIGDSSGGTAAGRLRITHGEALGTGTKWVFCRNGSSSIELDGSAGNLSVPAHVSLMTSGPSIRNLAGANVIEGAIQMNSGAGSTSIQCDAGSLTLNGTINAGSVARTLVLSGSSTSISTINGAIANGSQPNSVTKSGSGIWKLAHPNNTYTGNTTVSAGTLILAGSLQSPNLSVSANARLVVERTPSTTGTFTLSSGSLLELRAMPSETDRLSVGGTVTLAGTLDLMVSPGTSGGGSFLILNNRGSQPVTGTFTGLPEGAQFSAGGINWQITYSGGDGNDVVLTREPGALQTFEERRDLILGKLRGQPFVKGYISPNPGYKRPEAYTYMDFALRCFLNDEQIPEANAAVAAFCALLMADGDPASNLDWMSEMAFRILEEYGSQGRIAPGKLTQANEDAMLEVFWQHAKRFSNLTYTSTTLDNIWKNTNGTENLSAMSVATLWHAAKLLRNHPAYAGLVYDNGVTPEAYYQASTAYYKQWLRERARKGMLIEFSNNHYNPVTIKGIYNFVDFAEDMELRELARKWLDLFWTTWGQEQIGGVKGGGMARIYQGALGKNISMNGWLNPLSDIFWCYTGLGIEPVPTNNVLTYLASSYRPSAVALDIACDQEGRGTFASIERKMGRTDLNETFTRYTYTTPDYVLGTFHVPDLRYWDWQMISSQNRWHGAIFKGHPDARIYFQCTAETGLNYNQHWSVQSRNAIMVQKLDNNGSESTRHAKYALEMKVWVAAPGRTDLVERDGWVFASYGSAYAALKVLDGGFTWTNDPEPAFSGQWMVLENEYSPVVMEVGRAADFASFTAFQDQILTNPLSFASATVNYQSTLGDTLTLYTNYSASPKVNGVTLNYKPSKAYDSPFASSDFNSGVVSVQKGNRQMTLDFNTQVPATFTWNAGNDVWDTNTKNWNNATTTWPNHSGATAVFESPSANVILTPGIYPGALTFNTGTVLSGAPLQLPGFQPALQTAAGITARIDAAVSGESGLSKTGPGTLILAGNNTLKGVSRILDGTLQIGHGGSSGTPGSMSIVNSASLVINRSGTVTFPSSISGIGSITIQNPTAADTVVLAGNNSFTGNLALNLGTLRLAHSSALGTAARTLIVDGSNKVIQLGGDAPVVLPPTLTFTASGSSLFNFAGDNRIDGTIQLSEPTGATITSLAGSLNLAGTISGGNTARSLELTGSSTGDNVVSGIISDGTQPTLLLKSGPGTWRISGAQSFTGNTTVTGGTLVLGGSLSGNVDITGGQLAASGTASIAGNLTIASNGSLQARPDASLDVGGTLTLAGNLSVNFPRGILLGSQFHLLRKTSAGPASGTFTGLPQGQTFTASGYLWSISYTGGDGNDIVLTTLTGPSTPIEVWRDQNFGFFTNTGIAADAADPDGDGITNAQEFTLGTHPNDPNSPASFDWIQPAGGNWTTPANWSANIAPAGNASRRLAFFPGASLPGGNTSISNNFVGAYALNRLQLDGECATTHAVNLTGAALDFRSSNGTAPSIELSTAPVTYTLSNNATLSADLAIESMNGGQAILSGILSGPGGITFTGTGNNLVLSGNNSYQGTTRIIGGLQPGTITPFAGTLQIGNGGSTGSPGSGPIVNDGTLTFNRTGTLQVANTISGTGRLTVNLPSSSHTVSISGDNRFTGDITITRGRLVINRSTALGTGEKSVTANQGNARLELDGGTTGITLAPNISFTLSGTELRNTSGNNTVQGIIGAATGAGGSTITSNSGTLTLTGSLQSLNSGGRTVTLGGTSTGANAISGRIVDGVSALTLLKSGTGTWMLSHPDNSYTGPTTITAGKLVLSGDLTSPINVTGGSFAPQGAPATTASFTQAAAAVYQIRATPSGADRLTVGGTVTLDGTLEILTTPGVASGTGFIILNNTGNTAITGSFTSLPENATFSSGGYDWRITYVGGDGNDVVLTNVTPPNAIESWRMLHFGIMANTGTASDSADPDRDGESNLLEFATAQNPHASTRASTSATPTGSTFLFTYTRSKAALDDGYGFVIEYSDSFAPGSWTAVGPGTVVIDGFLQTVSSNIPMSPAGRRFARVRVITP